MEDLKTQAIREIDALRESIRQFNEGEIAPEQFRPRRLAYGIYAQLPHTSNMLRLKIPAGVATARQLETIANIAEKYGRSLAHVTTRQDIQFHWIPLEACPEIFTDLLEVGIINRGACSDSIRNVTACPNAGLCCSEKFDVIPYALAINDFFLFHPFNLTLPRKFKISLSGCEDDCALGSMHEIGIIAATKETDGKVEEGFKIKAAGGLGSLPHLAPVVKDFVPKEDLLIVCEGIVRLFHRYGNRENRLRARMKFFMKKVGYDEYVRLLDVEIANVEAESGDTLREHLQNYTTSFTPPEAVRPNGIVFDAEIPEEGKRWVETNVSAQKQKGYNTVLVKLRLGDVSSDQLRALARIVSELGNGTIRTTVSQNLSIPFIHDFDIAELYSRLGEIDLMESDVHHINDVVSCPGADYCSIAITSSMGVGAKVIDHLREGATDVERLGNFRIQISGCPNACGQHPLGDIGLTGLMVKGKDGVERPHYNILVGGGITGDSPQLAQRLKGKYPEEETPKIIAAITNDYLENKKDGESFKEFVNRKEVKYFVDIAQSISGTKRIEVEDAQPPAVD